jgi:hypothetical protein
MEYLLTAMGRDIGDLDRIENAQERRAHHD